MLKQSFFFFYVYRSRRAATWLQQSEIINVLAAVIDNTFSFNSSWILALCPSRDWTVCMSVILCCRANCLKIWLFVRVKKNYKIQLSRSYEILRAFHSTPCLIEQTQEKCWWWSAQEEKDWDFCDWEWRPFQQWGVDLVCCALCGGKRKVNPEKNLVHYNVCLSV